MLLPNMDLSVRSSPSFTQQTACLSGKNQRLQLTKCHEFASTKLNLTIGYI